MLKKCSYTDKTTILIATGGKENDLKVWNLKLDSKDPIFRAKNVPNNWIQLREPVNVTSIDFLDQTKVAVGTAYHQVSRNKIFFRSKANIIKLNFI